MKNVLSLSLRARSRAQMCICMSRTEKDAKCEKRILNGTSLLFVLLTCWITQDCERKSVGTSVTDTHTRQASNRLSTC